MSNDTTFSLLLDMDSLMDTRMGTLIRLYPEISQVMDIVTYRKRQRDNYTELTGGVVTTEAFQKQYQARDIETLRLSLITGVIPILLSYIESLEERLHREVDITAIRVYLNLHPYRLPGPILEEILSNLRSILPPYVDVTAVREEPDQLTPDRLGARYNGWITYDFNGWLELHHEALLFRPINSVSAIIPRLLQREPGEVMEDGQEDPFKDADKHGLFAMVMEDYIHLEHLDVEDYCFLIPGTYKPPQSVGASGSTEPTKSS